MEHICGILEVHKVYVMLADGTPSLAFIRGTAMPHPARGIPGWKFIGESSFKSRLDSSEMGAHTSRLSCQGLWKKNKHTTRWNVMIAVASFNEVDNSTFYHTFASVCVASVCLSRPELLRFFFFKSFELLPWNFKQTLIVRTWRTSSNELRSSSS